MGQLVAVGEGQLELLGVRWAAAAAAVFVGAHDPGVAAVGLLAGLHVGWTQPHGGAVPWCAASDTRRLHEPRGHRPLQLACAHPLPASPARTLQQVLGMEGLQPWHDLAP